MSHEGMAPFSGMSRMRNPKPPPNMYYPQGEGPPLMPPMQQMRMNQPSYLDDRQMNSPCGYPRMPMGGTPPEFKSPQMMPTMTEAPGPAPKKKRRNAASAAPPPPAPPPIMDMMPPPLSGYGDTVVASNPFDDMPSHHHHPPPPMMMPPHRGMPPGGPPPHGMNSPMMPGPMSPMMRSPLQDGMMGPGGPMQMSPMGMMSPMGQHQMPPMSHQQQPPPQQHQPPFAQMAPKPMPVTTGKIYPPDQPMVFNPQNPNAPPIYPCGICHKEVHDNDQAILCESGCNFWFHRICTGLTEAAYQMLTAEVYAEWVCDKCLASKNIPLVKCKP